MGMTFSHLLPGSAGFAATVVTPWYSADPGVIRSSIVLLLSFVLLCVAIAVFLRSLKEKGKQVSIQGHAAESQMFQTLEQAIEKGRASLDINVDPDADLDVAAPPNTHEEIPSPLAELALQFDKLLPEPQPESRTEHDQSPRLTPGTNGNVFAHPPANPARPETAHVETARAETAHLSLPRLSELRGMRFSQALRELDRAKRSAQPNAGPASLNSSFNGSLNGALADPHDDTPNGALNDLINDPINETLMSAIAPFETMFAPTASAPGAQNGATAVNQNGAQGRPSQQTFFPPKPAPPENSRGRRREDSARYPDEPKAPEKETNAFLDQLHILPSRRGQYKKKG